MGRSKGWCLVHTRSARERKTGEREREGEERKREPSRQPLCGAIAASYGVPLVPPQCLLISMVQDAKGARPPATRKWGGEGGGGKN